MQTQPISTIRPGAALGSLGKPLSFGRLGRPKQLGECPLFEGLHPDEIRALQGCAQTRTVEKGQSVFFPEEPAGRVYFVASGRVKISRISLEGKEFILDFVEPGEMFGEAGIFDGGPREANAETMERSVIVSLPSERLRSFLHQKPAILLRFVAMIGSRQKRLEKRLVDVAHKSANRRLAELLVELSQSYGIRDARGMLVRIKLSQAALGNLLGVSREVVNHAFSDLRRRGVIDVAEGRVIIQNPEALALAAL